MKVNPHRSSLGMDANVMALLAYLATLILSFIPFVKYIAWLAPLVLFFLEKESPFVKFHAIQAFIINVVNAVLGFIFYLITIATLRSVFYYGVGAGYGIVVALTWIVFAIIGIFSIIAMVKAYGYFEYKIPLAGNLAEKFSRKGNIPR